MALNFVRFTSAFRGHEGEPIMINMDRVLTVVPYNEDKEKSVLFMDERMEDGKQRAEFVDCSIAKMQMAFGSKIVNP